MITLFQLSICMASCFYLRGHSNLEAPPTTHYLVLIPLTGKNILFSSPIPRSQLSARLQKLLQKHSPRSEDFCIERDLFSYTDLAGLKGTLYRQPASVKLKASIPWNSVSKYIIEVRFNLKWLLHDDFLHLH